MLQALSSRAEQFVREADGCGVEGPSVPLEPAMRREYRFYVYIIQSASRRALYIGMTSNLRKRVWQHKNHSFEGFTDDYNASRLVYWESSYDVHKAISRELVETTNPRWQDLSAGWYETQGPSTAAPVHFVSERPRSG